jgi:hypothetical protein
VGLSLASSRPMAVLYFLVGVSQLKTVVTMLVLLVLLEVPLSRMLPLPLLVLLVSNRFELGARAWRVRDVLS